MKKLIILFMAIFCTMEVHAIENITTTPIEGAYLCRDSQVKKIDEIKYDDNSMIPLTPINNYDFEKYFKTLYKGSMYESSDVADIVAFYPILKELYPEVNADLTITYFAWKYLYPTSEVYMCDINGDAVEIDKDLYNSIERDIYNMKDGYSLFKDGIVASANRETVYSNKLFNYLSVYDSNGFNASIDGNDLKIITGDGEKTLILKRKSFSLSEPLIIKYQNNYYLTVPNYSEKKLITKINALRESFVIYSTVKDEPISGTCFSIYEGDTFVQDMCSDENGVAQTFLKTGSYTVKNQNYTAYEGDFEQMDITIVDQKLEIVRNLNTDVIIYNPEDTLALAKVAIVITSLLMVTILYKKYRKNRDN